MNQARSRGWYIENRNCPEELPNVSPRPLYQPPQSDMVVYAANRTLSSANSPLPVKCPALRLQEEIFPEYRNVLEVFHKMHGAPDDHLFPMVPASARLFTSSSGCLCHSGQCMELDEDTNLRINVRNEMLCVGV